MIALGATILLLIAIVIYFKIDSVHKDHEIQRQARAAALRASRTHDALCAFRAELADRVPPQQRKLNRSRKFLDDHPDGIPGIPPSLIRAGIADDALTLRRTKRAVMTLSGLHCQ
jgi:hypothetical protein